MKYLMHIYLKVYKKTEPHLVLYFMNEKKKKTALGNSTSVSKTLEKEEMVLDSRLPAAAQGWIRL